MSCALIVLAGSALPVSGCLAEAQLVQQASFDHQCPEANVVVAERSGDPFSPSARVEVCGSMRVYRDFNGGEGVMWVDVTDGAPAVPVIQPPPNVPQNNYYFDNLARQRRNGYLAPPSHRSSSPPGSYSSAYDRR